MVFLNYNKIFDIDILNLETACNTTEIKIVTYFVTACFQIKGRCLIYIYVKYILNGLLKSNIHTIRPCQNIHRNAPGGQICNFQIALDRASNEIRMKIHTENFFGILISTRLVKEVNHIRCFAIDIAKDLILLSCRLAMEHLCVLQLETALATLVTTWFTLADRR